ncbi:MAG: class I SAM-dependent methyltransferase [Actinobacteria bacterium]|nr:class I SAM-dependent methyltransferase [Actinomycetota bacterium]
MSGDHYFTAAPAGAAERRNLSVVLAERRLDVVTAGGVFSPDRVDAGTGVLLREAPAPPERGHLLDLGCGWGPIALSLALRSPQAHVYAADVNERAIALVRANAELVGAGNITACRPDEVPAGLRFRTIWSNPPIRVGKAVLHEMLASWLPRLDAGATAYLVVQKNLGSDSLQRWVNESLEGLRCERYATSRGYRLLSVSWA